MKNTPQLLIFDVNETLLDLSPLKENINQLLNSSFGFEIWFSKLLQYSMVNTLAGSYSDFGVIALETLEMTCKTLSRPFSKSVLKEKLSVITTLKAHKGVPKTLETLKHQGFRLVALTNGGKTALNQQMKNSNLEVYFDQLYSVEAIKKFKPHPDTYTYVLKQEKHSPQQAMLVAAHAWDIIGAQNAGLQTAFIKRSGKVLYPTLKQPNYVCNTFEELTSLFK